MFKRISELSRLQTIALGFLLIVLVGTLLLMLPFSTRQGESTTFLNALFTATSATCVTGLVVYDTYLHWSLFGQIVILTLIQLGGLGFITIGIYGMSVFQKKIGLKNREFIHDSLNLIHIGGGVKIVKRAIKGTFIIEFIAALLLSTSFIPEFGIVKGIYYSIFHSVSAFCNAGFDIMGVYGEYSSLTHFYDDPVVIITISAVILIGGIGFIVWNDICDHKFNFKKYLLHTKIVLTISAVLVIGGTVLFLITERNTVLADMAGKDKLLSALFLSVSPRTAGMNSVDIASLSGAGTILNILFMFIGGCPGSTAGGIKVTTIATVYFFLVSYIKKDKGYKVYKRSLDDDTIKKANTVIFVNLVLAIFATFVISLNQNLDLTKVVVECFSAVGTVGITAGITRDLTLISKLVVIILMYCGRVGSLSFALVFSDKRKIPDIRYPVEQIVIG